MMKQPLDFEIESAKTWLDNHCHHAGVRQVLLRGVEYVEAMDRAGLTPTLTPGDELYDFLCDPGAASARFKNFMPPTL